MKLLGIKIPLKNGEQVRIKLFEANLVNKNYKIKNDTKFLYIPITQNVKINGTEIVEVEFKQKRKLQKSYKDIVEIPSKLKTLLPTSFDNIGKIILLKLPEDLLPYSEKIGEAFLRWKDVKSVAIDNGVKGEIRIRDLTIIAGIKETETIHKENGLFFKLDISKVYFSPRLATERDRIRKFVKKDEIIIDMFAGVGPFSILIAKKSKPRIIYAIDMNQEAIKYLKENVQKNKVKNVIPIDADAKDAVIQIEKADRIIMNLPHSAFKYFEYAMKALKTSGIIHYYEILYKENIDKRILDLEKIIKENSYKIVELNKKIVKSYSAKKIHIALDFYLKNMI